MHIRGAKQMRERNSSWASKRTLLLKRNQAHVPFPMKLTMLNSFFHAHPASKAENKVSMIKSLQ